jgi:preprotein translocase subunit SecF
MINIVKAVYAAVLFYLLTPGVLLRLPRKGSKLVVAFTHGVVFVVVFCLTYKIILGFTGQTNEGMKVKSGERINFGDRFMGHIPAEKKRREAHLKDIEAGQNKLKAVIAKAKEDLKTTEIDLENTRKEIASTTKKTPDQIKNLKIKVSDLQKKVTELNAVYTKAEGEFTKGHQYHLSELAAYEKFMRSNKAILDTLFPWG